MEQITCNLQVIKKKKNTIRAKVIYVEWKRQTKNWTKPLFTLDSPNSTI